MDQKKVLMWFRRQRQLKIILPIAGVLLLLFIAFASMRFTTITVEGSTRYSDEEIEAYLFEDSWSKNPLIFMFRERTRSHREIPFVEKYTVHFKGLDSLEIIVYEKDLIGYVKRMGCYMYFDQDGIVVESSSEKMSNIPGINGLGTAYIVLGEKLPVEDEDLLREILNISQYLQTTQIKWGDKQKLLVKLVKTIDFDRSWNVTLSVDKVDVYLGSNSDMEEKLLEMSSILPELYGKEGTLYLNTYRSSVANPTYIFK